MADEDKSYVASLFQHIPLIGRGAVGIALRAVAGKPEAIDTLAQHVYLDEYDQEPEVPWAKLSAKEKKVRRQAIRATLEGLDKLAKAAMG